MTIHDRVLVPSEAAQLLDLGVDELLDRAERGEIPGARLGGHWRFTHHAITHAAHTTLRRVGRGS